MCDEVPGQVILVFIALDTNVIPVQTVPLIGLFWE